MLLVKSLVLVCIITISGFFRISVFRWSHISVVTPGWFLTLTLKDSFDKPYWSMPFNIGSPMITAFLFAAFSYLWLWSNFFSSFFLSSHISLPWFSFNRFGFIFLLRWSCEIINEFPYWEAWSTYLIIWYICARQTISGFVGFVGVMSWSNVCFSRTTASVAFVYKQQKVFSFSDSISTVSHQKNCLHNHGFEMKYLDDLQEVEF